MRTVRSYILCPLLIIFFLQCGCSGGKLNTLEAANKSTGKNIEEIRSTQAEHGTELAEIRVELQQLRGKIEELQHTATGKTEQLERTLEQFGSRVPPPEGVPAQLLNRDEEQIAKNTGDAADMYRRALRQLRIGDFSGAATAFTEFVSRYGDTAYSDNALFFSGICYEKLGEYDKAILAYNDVLQKYPAEDMVPAALFRLGESFAKVGSTNDAVLTFDKLVDEFPRSEYSQEATKRRAELKRSASRGTQRKK